MDGRTEALTVSPGYDELPAVSPDGSQALFTAWRGADGGNYRVGVGGGRERMVIEAPWNELGLGVHFIDVIQGQTEGQPLRRYDPESRAEALAVTLPVNIYMKHPGFSVSRDGRAVLFTRKVDLPSEVMLIENFR